MGFTIPFPESSVREGPLSHSPLLLLLPIPFAIGLCMAGFGCLTVCDPRNATAEGEGRIRPPLYACACVCVCVCVYEVQVAAAAIDVAAAVVVIVVVVVLLGI